MLLQYSQCSQHEINVLDTVIMRRMGPGAITLKKKKLLLFFSVALCALSDGCNLSDTGAEIQLDHLVLVVLRHLRCHLSDGCDAEWYV